MPTTSGSEKSCDLLVVGGGINGCGIARDAAGRGLSVTLCEQDDLAAHTSSYSTKLIHGGLRYLEQWRFGLVRKALQEREVLLSSAPHLIRPLRFVMPHDAHLRPMFEIPLGSSCTTILRRASASQPPKPWIFAAIRQVLRLTRVFARASSTRMPERMMPGWWH
jgi:glycerol-3-phosphate dehydrogenase